MKIRAYYDVILKKLFITGFNMKDDNSPIKLRSKVRGEAVRTGLCRSIIEDYYEGCLMDKEKNPLLKSLKKPKWDGKDHLQQLANTITVRGNNAYKEECLKLWLIQCIAAIDGAENTPRKDAKAKYETILVMQSDQGFGKTTFFHDLLPRGLQKYFLSGATLRTGDKDSLMTVLSHAIVELGELDATFKKSDIAEIKSFTSKTEDNLRPPYGRDILTKKRRTSFCATVNSTEFLNDVTGARRFAVMAVKSINNTLLSKINIKQLWAQLWHLYIKGAKWWFERDSKWIKTQNKENEHHRHKSNAHDIVQEIKRDCKENVKRHQVSLSRLWEAYTDKMPTAIERSSFKEELRKAGFDCNKAHNYNLPTNGKLI